MHIIDFAIFIVYMAGVFFVGAYFFKKNKDVEDYFVGGRKIKSYHVGLSVVATDVGGGFSIGLGGLGYLTGLSGSWLLFTGLVGAWLSAIFIIPRIKKIDRAEGFMTFPDFLKHKYGATVAMVAAVISGVGYAVFTGGQILAGVKLSSATLFNDLPVAVDPKTFSIIVVAGIILIYTVLGGLKAVIYTDTIQWIVLICGLALFAIPFTIAELGGFGRLYAELPPEFFSLGNIEPATFINWLVTIVPIWLIAMTLYQRIFACETEKDAKRAWYIAGLFEYPIMAFVGVFLGMCSRVFFPAVESELGLPLLLREVLPIGVKGIVVAAYFSAIMSTADSCLIASSGNFVNDILDKFFKGRLSREQLIRASQLTTLAIGSIAIFIAVSFKTVLEIILSAYSFMVAALFIPTLAAYFIKKDFLDPKAALISMVAGGGFAATFLLMQIKLPFGLDPTFYGIIVSAAFFVIFAFILKNNSGGENV